MSLAHLSSNQRVAPAAADGVTVTPNTTAWANSAWVEIEDSTPEAWALTGISIGGPSTNVATLIAEVGVGPMGSETPIAALPAQTGSSSFAEISLDVRVPVPVDLIPAGSRVSVRIRKSGTSSADLTAKIQYLPKPLDGDVPTTTQPLQCARVSVTGAGSSWADGAYAEVLASAAGAVSIAGFSVTSRSGFHNTWGEIDFGVGASSSEVVRHTESFKTDSDFFGNSFLPLYVWPLRSGIPAGSRLAIRVRLSSSSSATTDLFVMFYEDLEDAVVEAVSTEQPGTTTTPGAVGTSVASSAEPFTWVEVIASTATPIAITSTLTNGPLVCTLILATGEAGQEVEQARWVIHGTQQQPLPYSVTIPAGTRVALAVLSPGLGQTPQIKLGYTANPDHAQLAEAAYSVTSVTVPTVASVWTNGAEATVSDGTAESEPWAIAACILSSGGDASFKEVDVLVGDEIVYTFATYQELNTGSGGRFFHDLPVPLRVPAQTAVTMRARKSPASGTSGLTFAVLRYDGETVTPPPPPPKEFDLIDAVESAPAVRLRPDPAVFDRLLRKQQHVFDTYGPVRPPRLGESGDPDFVGRAARFGIEVATWGDVDGLDAYVLLPGCFDDALASGRAVVLLDLHHDKLVLASTLTGALQLETDTTGLRVGVLCPELVELWDQGVRFAGLSGFSTHHSTVHTMEDGRRVAFVHRADLVEVSLVAEPGTPRAPGTWLTRATPAAWSRFADGE